MSQLLRKSVDICLHTVWERL